jgi:hypothetical protein
MLVSVPHFYTVTRSCDGQQVTVVENQVVVNNVVDPTTLAPLVGGPDTVNPGTGQPTFFVGPKQIVFLTLRLVGKFDPQFASRLAGRAGVIVRSQPDKSAIDQSDDDQDGTIDVTPPTLDLSGVTALAHVEGNSPGGATVTVNVTANDESGPASVSCVRTNASGSAPLPVDGTATFIPLGTWTATCTASDAAGNETGGQFPIAVVDSVPPTVDVSGVSGTLTLTPTSGGFIITYAPAAASDVVDPSVTVTCTPPSGTKLPLGQNTVTCTATDHSGNTATAVYTFNVTDTVPPVLTLPAPIVVAATSLSGAVVTFSATAVDVVDGNRPVVCTPASGTTFAIGVKTVSCTASDLSGNVATGTFTVTVNLQPPTITATATPNTLLWSPNKLLVPVTISGATTGLGLTVTYKVTDEYGKVQPSGTVTLDANGRYSFVIKLEAYRNGTDADGRFYTVVVTAKDTLGRTVSATAIVRVPHDQQ